MQGVLFLRLLGFVRSRKHNAKMSRVGLRRRRGVGTRPLLVFSARARNQVEVSHDVRNFFASAILQSAWVI